MFWPAWEKTLDQTVFEERESLPLIVQVMARRRLIGIKEVTFSGGKM